MASLHSELRADLARAYHNLLQHNQALSEAILNETQFPAWIDGHERLLPADWRSARMAIVDMVNETMFEDHEASGKDTRQMPGVIACSEHTLQQLERLNLAKKELQKILMAMDKIMLEIPSSESDQMVKVPLSRKALSDMGLARLNRIQVCRKFISVSYPLEYAGFFWNRYVPSVRLTAKQIIEDKLRALGSEDPEDPSDQRLQHDYRLMRSLRGNEYLALIKTEIVHRRVNLVRVIADKYRQCPEKCQRLAYAPIFYLHDADFQIPRIRPLPQSVQDQNARRKRSDVEIDEEPFLLTLNVHRYKPPKFADE
ncbi:hypothetical protein Q9L42_013190 [Methylomarinum sp. Ch1-1]|uniref:DNA replication terminus site-binding protein n=1 Tax=Methylomarinum roseum TaxID=3067653 RepID=A0AAU7NQR7_9GAMM|nr:hypothetical protein [Methylomarinum sp. Ch1-1]MDP4520719.1 hypothetical protein [Methylomarinum sp. Ch1-1]